MVEQEPDRQSRALSAVEATSFVHALATLRWFAIAGQLLAIGLAAWLLRSALPLAPMLAAVVLLAGFNGFVWAGLRRGGGFSSLAGFAHMGMDVAVLAFLVGCSGGAANPFTSLFLLPIAFAALALPGRWIVATALVCALGYALAAAWGRPLPPVHGLGMDGFDLHLLGMAVNFLISAVVFVYFLARMATQRRERERELAQLRERQARDEGILALATHAASVAHQLNTPLATMLLALDELQDQELPGDLSDELALLRKLAEICRERVRELAHAGHFGQSVDPVEVVERWHLLRPAIEITRRGELSRDARVDAGVGHLLRALLDNAADASIEAGSTRVRLDWRVEDGQLLAEVSDQGRGLDPRRGAATAGPFRSAKPHGMGVGLVLSHAVIERLGGTLETLAGEGGGTRVRFRVALAAPKAP